MPCASCWASTLVVAGVGRKVKAPLTATLQLAILQDHEDRYEAHCRRPRPPPGHRLSTLCRPSMFLVVSNPGPWRRPAFANKRLNSGRFAMRKVLFFERSKAASRACGTVRLAAVPLASGRRSFSINIGMLLQTETSTLYFVQLGRRVMWPGLGTRHGRATLTVGGRHAPYDCCSAKNLDKLLDCPVACHPRNSSRCGRMPSQCNQWHGDKQASSGQHPAACKYE